MSESTAVMPGLDEAKTKSTTQKRFDQITREKYAFKREAETLRAESAELRSELQQAKSLLKNYRAELEKYRAKFVELAVKEKHVRNRN